MALGPYDLCTCGSGKQFKWCCQPIHHEIQKAFEQAESGQHEAALKTMQAVVARHPDSAHAHGRLAQLLYQHNQGEAAEAALDRAFQLNPSYAFGYFLRAQFRDLEGDVRSAAFLYHKAADLYHPDAHEILGVLQSQLANCELRLHHPVASRAALDQTLRHESTNTELRKLHEHLFGEGSDLPLAARKAYSFRPIPADAPAERKAAWQKALTPAATGKLGDARRAFEELTTAAPQDGPAWFNLGLTRAWQGDNVPALEALDRYIELESDDTRAAEAAALACVLRTGWGLEESEADVCGRSRVYRVTDPQRLMDVIGQLIKDNLFANPTLDRENNQLSGVLLEKPTVLGGALDIRPMRIGAHLLFNGAQAQLANVDGELLTSTLREFAAAAGPALGEFKEVRVPAQPHDFLAEGLVYPASAKTEAEAVPIVSEGLARYFEDTWIHRPLRSLRGVPPIDAVGSPVLRRKLLGVIDYLSQCATSRNIPYDWDRLRRKLGLFAPAPAQPATATSTPTLDIAAMSMAELGQLQLDSLNEAQVETAWQTAQRLDAPDLAATFLKNLVARPLGEKKDRFPWFNALVTRALREGNGTAALDFVNEGEKFDCEHNEGQRRNDYELRRAQVHAKQGEIEAAGDVFDRLIARVPDEARYRSNAAEAMLSARQGARARRYAEDGLALARKQNNRDSEGHFLELVEAARKQGG